MPAAGIWTQLIKEDKERARGWGKEDKERSREGDNIYMNWLENASFDAYLK